MVSRRIETLLAQLRQQGIHDEHLLKAIADVPRERFIDEAFEHKAWITWRSPSAQARRFHSPIWWRG